MLPQPPQPRRQPRLPRPRRRPASPTRSLATTRPVSFRGCSFGASLQEPAASCLPRAIRPPRHRLARADASTLVNRWSAADVSSLLDKMKAATMVKRGDPGIKTTVEGARDEMNRFVAYYRRNNKVAGAASFSTLYTAISTLSGHFQNYGPEYPVPAKRQKVAIFP